MSTGYWTYRPSKRPKVSQVDEWREIYSDYNYEHWRGDAYAGEVRVYTGYPFPDYYKVTFRPKGEPKAGRPKYFYGESAWNEAERYVYDLGFPMVLGQL